MSNITKLGLGIIAFEGLEHIKNITYEIRPLVDTIVVCLQQTSYLGEPIDDEDVKAAEQLKDLGYIDDIIWFVPEDFHESEGPAGPRMIETDKRNFILDYLEFFAHCSHSLVIDSDEFYDYSDFAKAKNIISENENIVITYCQYINYYRDYQHTMVWPFLSYVPFITESKYRFDFKHGMFDKASDPTRRYFIPDHKSFHIFPFNLVKMHHLSWIRLDISKKIKSWSAQKYFENVKGLKDAILDRYNNYIDGQCAIIMFNVPYYSVIVDLLPKQYIHPKYRLNEIPESLI
jgi:hypothetical protein